MPKLPNYGAKLSTDDYDRKVIALYDGQSPMPDKEEDTDLRRKELDLMVDHRLGIDFPKDRREALFQIQKKVEKKRIRLSLKYAVRSVIDLALARDGEKLAGFLISEFTKVLTPEEIDAFLGLEKGERPKLSIDS